MSTLLRQRRSAQSTQSPPGSWSRPATLVRWATGLLLVGVAAALVRAAAQPVRDPDTWWHLRLGEEFQGNWSLGDPGTMTPFATADWMATQWLTEVVMHWFQDAFGIHGIVWLTGAGTLALAVTAFISCRGRSDVLAAGVATIVMILGASASISPRPQLASFVLLSLVVSVWLRTADDLKPRWWLVALTWLWANVHGMWLLGPLVGVAVTLGIALEGRASRRQLTKLLAVPLASIAAAAATPVGPGLVLAPFATRGMGRFVTEWLPPSIRDLHPALTLTMIALVVVTWLRRNGSVRFPHIALLVLATGWALFAGRTVALGAIIAAPLLAAAIQEWIGRVPPAVTRAERGGVALAATGILAMLAVTVPTAPAVNETHFPERLSARLSALPPGTVIFNQYFVGGWLEWKHRNVVPVVDGMTHAYTVESVARTYNAYLLQPGWHEWVRETGADYALLKSNTPLPLELEKHYDWDQVDEDPVAHYVLLRAPD